MKHLDSLLEEIQKRKNVTLFEEAPPNKKIEKWILKMKPAFKKRYGERWKEVLYSLAWKKYNQEKK